ncbi:MULTISPECIES: hypothetical protein [Bradyrhizobium]|jgi:hypothetical protein|uniref:hypothetical protein n=1 Tax=Bradyrhizobium TaxID=374 RepID=UPI002011560F|nr:MULTISPECIES: hypothetical protein [Bradyrhizobium]WOH74946.1 hypothetical protein RX330_07435 [Bradyrhizobium sp. NDS-1]
MARLTRLPYLVSGTNEYGSSNLGRGTATVALRYARKLLREGYMDVRVCTPRGRVLQPDEFDQLKPPEESDMAKGQQRGNRETKKPKKEKSKVIAAAPSRKDAAWQPDFGPTKKK